MLLQGFINLASYLLLVIINMLPDANPQILTFLSEKFAIVKDLLLAINFLFDVNTLLWVLGIALTTEAILFGFKIFEWIVTNLTVGLYKRIK
jgi:hypothetical protein